MEWTGKPRTDGTFTNLYSSKNRGTSRLSPDYRPPTTHGTVADPDDLRRLPPGDLLRHRPQNYFLYLHSPLRRGPRVAFHAWHGLLLSPPAKAADHVLTQPDNRCANNCKILHLDKPFPRNHNAADILQDVRIVGFLKSSCLCSDSHSAGA